MKLKNTIIFLNAEVPLQITSQVFLITRHVLNFERAGLQCFIDAKKRQMLLAKLDGYGRHKCIILSIVGSVKCRSQKPHWWILTSLDANKPFSR